MDSLPAARQDPPTVHRDDRPREGSQILERQQGKVALNIPIILAGDRLTLDAAAELIRRDYAINERRSEKSMGHALVNVLARLGGTTRLARVTTAQVEAYKSARLVAGAKPATVNRELAALSRMASLAKHQHGLAVTFTNGPAP